MESFQLESELRRLKPELNRRFHVGRIGYFGSVSTGDQHAASDIDLLVEFSEPIGWDFFTLEKFLEKELKRKVDVVTHAGVRRELAESVYSNVKFV